MEKVYIESTIPSYIIDKPSRDLVTTSRQQLTREWWESQAERFELYVSELVLSEIRKGNIHYAKARLSLVQHLPVLKMIPEVEQLAEIYMNRLSFLPSQAKQDALHIALAVVSELDYLLTWNCRHIANGQVMRWVGRINQELGYPLLTIVTPDELLT